IEKYLAGLRSSRLDSRGRHKPGISIASSNYHLGAFKSFCRWMVRDRRATESPIAHLQPLNARTDRRHDRRALQLDELQWLINSTAVASTRFGMTGSERALLYQMAVETGLRASELRSLTKGSLDLIGHEPSVKISAAYAKNRRHDQIPLRAE